MEIIELAERFGLAHLAPDLATLTSPAIRIKTKRVEEKDLAVGVSKIGGLPDLLSDVAWPEFQGLPMTHVAQLNLAEVAAAAPLTPLPATGLLHFFYDARMESWGYKPEDADAGRVLYCDRPATELRRAPTPLAFRKNDIYPGVIKPFALEFIPIVTLPPWESTIMRPLLSRKEDTQRYWELEKYLKNRQSIKQPEHQLLGHPLQIQGDMQLCLALVAAGQELGPGADWRNPEIQSAAREWRLLLQVDTEDDPPEKNMLWHDVGLLYFFLRESDLLAGDFSKVRIQLECG